MLDAKKLRNISENAEKRRRTREQRNARKDSSLQKTQAKRIAKELIPKAERKVEMAARQGLDKIRVYFYQDSFGSLENEVARLVSAHFSKNFRVSNFVHEEGGCCYYGTDVVVHIR